MILPFSIGLVSSGMYTLYAAHLEGSGGERSKQHFLNPALP